MKALVKTCNGGSYLTGSWDNIFDTDRFFQDFNRPRTRVSLPKVIYV